MGEIAEMMLDGTLCEGCGVYVGSDGGPSYCRACQREQNQLPTKAKPAARAMPPVVCPDCGRKVKMTGIADHWRAMHGATVTVNAGEVTK